MVTKKMNFYRKNCTNFVHIICSCNERQFHRFLECRICFAVGEILLLIGISVESGHRKNWSASRTNCLVLNQGLFLAAGVFGLTTVVLASGLYITALRAQKLLHEEESMRRQVFEAAMLYASPPRSPGNSLQTLGNESPVTRQHNEQELSMYITAMSKLN